MNANDDAWLDALLQLDVCGETAVLVSVIAARGSAPREAGTKMVVARETFAGTIGGGHLELQAIEIARGMLNAGPAGDLRRFPLGAALGQCCGGSVDLLFESVQPGAAWVQRVRELHTAEQDCVIVSRAEAGTEPGKLVVCADGVAGNFVTASLVEMAIEAARALLVDGEASLRRIAGNTTSNATALFFDPVRVPDMNIVLFGAGHVARALVHAMTGVACRITWVDERAHEFPLEIPSHARAVVTDAPDEAVDTALPGSYFLVMTHSHALDQALTERILRRDDFAYFGLIGSATKRRLFERRLAARGVPSERFSRMTCPIGVHGITGKSPAVIALAVAAELLQVREARAQRGIDATPRSISAVRTRNAERTA